MTPEKKIKKKIMEFLNSQSNIFAWTVEQRPGMARGCSDILACYGPEGKLLCIETKAPGRTTTPLQDRFLSKVRSAGGLAIVAYSLNDVREFLSTILKDFDAK